jgi:hypothetical protein
VRGGQGHSGVSLSPQGRPERLGLLHAKVGQLGIAPGQLAVAFLLRQGPVTGSARTSLRDGYAHPCIVAVLLRRHIVHALAVPIEEENLVEHVGGRIALQVIDAGAKADPGIFTVKHQAESF